MAARGEMTVRFWGVRGSHPTPGSDKLRYGGNTACVEVEAGGSTIILDAGTGIVPLSQSIMRQLSSRAQRFSCLLLLSHLHHDHTQGFPFFRPARIPGAEIYACGPEFHGQDVRATLELIMQPPHFPLALQELNANLHFQTINGSNSFYFGANGISSNNGSVDDTVQVSVHSSDSHPGGVLHYRIDWRGTSLVYATDIEGCLSGESELKDFASGADLLIHDAQYTEAHYTGKMPGMPATQGYGHSTVQMACQAAQEAAVKRLVLFHHAPEYDDTQLDQMAIQAHTLFAGAEMAYEGLEIHLGG